MPIFFQQDMDSHTRLAVWKIEEGEQFFLRSVPLQQDISHPHKRLQHLAGRYLLRYLYPSFPVDLIRVADTRKPFLEDEAFHFSISHCGDFAAVIVSTANRVGVDIERVSDKTERIRHKFMTPEEEALLKFPQAAAAATLLWSVKESVFKWYGAGGIDFRGHIQLEAIRETSSDLFLSQVRFTKNEDRLLELHSRLFSGLCLSHVSTSVSGE
jgi:phosphopantetheinyl transferase